jgi:MATE family multidrug resistance protein
MTTSQSSIDGADRSVGTPAAGSLRELIRVALPLVLSAGSHSLMSAADRIILAGYSADGLAAVTPASMLHWTVVCIPLGTILYANTFIAQYDGAGLRDRMLASLWQALWLAVISGILLIICVPYSHRLFALTGQPAGVIDQEAIYFNALCSGSVFVLLSMGLGCYFSGRQRTQVVMCVNMLGVLINFGLDYVLVFGVGPFPEMGIRGAAVATVLARVGEIVIYLMLILRDGRKDSASASVWHFWRPQRDLLMQYLRYGVPSGLHYFVDNSGFTVFLMLVGNLGRDALAATNLAFSVNGLIFVPLLGFGTAIQTLVGHHLGAENIRAAVRTTWTAAGLGIFWTGLAAVLLVLFPHIALQPFFLFAGTNPESGTPLNQLTPTIILLLQFVAVYSVFDALAVVFSSALRGAGDTVFPMVLTMCSSWLVMVLPAWWLIRSGSATLTSIWMTCSLHISIAGGCMLLRFLSGRWKRIRLVATSSPTENTGIPAEQG